MKNDPLCRFCLKPRSLHIDPPTQAACETDCLGSLCNFKPVAHHQALAQAWDEGHAAAMDAVGWGDGGSRNPYR